MVKVTLERLEFDGPDLVVQVRVSKGTAVINAAGEPSPASERPALVKCAPDSNVVPLRRTGS